MICNDLHDLYGPDKIMYSSVNSLYEGGQLYFPKRRSFFGENLPLIVRYHFCLP